MGMRITSACGPWRLAAALMAGAAVGAATVRADLGEVLAGGWTMSDESPALNDPKNTADFRISGVTPVETHWSDGTFAFAWAGDTAGSRGYYSLETGRVWVTTRRYVNGRITQVEYRGGLQKDGSIRWEGTAGTRRPPPASWRFVAEKR